MALDEKKKWRCPDCGTISLEKDFLKAASPFNKEETLFACPICFAVDGMYLEEICDEPGCNETAHYGFPSGDEFGGYRRTCRKHYYLSQKNERS
jgi:predicted RNA-binding Zn-ribbon protein involved in translation (DUF1610 family)